MLRRAAVRALAPATRRTYVVMTPGVEDSGHLKRNKYHSVLEGEFKLISGEVLPEVRIDWEQWVRTQRGDCEQAACVCGQHVVSSIQRTDCCICDALCLVHVLGRPVAARRSHDPRAAVVLTLEPRCIEP